MVSMMLTRTSSWSNLSHAPDTQKLLQDSCYVLSLLNQSSTQNLFPFHIQNLTVNKDMCLLLHWLVFQVIQTMELHSLDSEKNHQGGVDTAAWNRVKQGSPINPLQRQPVCGMKMSCVRGIFGWMNDDKDITPRTLRCSLELIVLRKSTGRVHCLKKLYRLVFPTVVWKWCRRTKMIT